MYFNKTKTCTVICVSIMLVLRAEIAKSHITKKLSVYHLIIVILENTPQIIAKVNNN